MPYYDELLAKYPHTLIEASGVCVGLPAGVMGNSNVGHLCMGAGRVVLTDIERINHEIKTGEFQHNLALAAAVESAHKRERALHIMGLTSDGLVHSSQEHAYALLRMAKERGLTRVFVHCFLDGRDTPPSSLTSAPTARANSPLRSPSPASTPSPRPHARTCTSSASPSTTRRTRCPSPFPRRSRATSSAKSSARWACATTAWPRPRSTRTSPTSSTAGRRWSFRTSGGSSSLRRKWRLTICSLRCPPSNSQTKSSAP